MRCPNGEVGEMLGIAGGISAGAFVSLGCTNWIALAHQASASSLSPSRWFRSPSLSAVRAASMPFPGSMDQTLSNSLLASNKLSRLPISSMILARRWRSSSKVSGRSFPDSDFCMAYPRATFRNACANSLIKVIFYKN